MFAYVLCFVYLAHQGFNGSYNKLNYTQRQIQIFIWTKLMLNYVIIILC